MDLHRCYGCMRMITEIVCPHCGHPAGTVNESHQLPEGTVLGQYVIGRAIGQGGFGITYIALDTQLDMPVAIKEFYPRSVVGRNTAQSSRVIPQSQSLEQQYTASRERFFREGKTLARLQHIPEIVTVHNSFQANNTAYLVMEYIHGTDLQQYVAQKGGTLSAAELFSLVEPLFPALESVHKAGLVHRDIKPANIRITEDGRIKLIDFGAVHASVPGGTGTSTEAVVTHGFAPLEQYYSRGELQAWTDEYALCATVYYCLTGQIPPDALSRVSEQTHPDWNSIPGLTSAQRSALRKGMSIESAQRYPTVMELHNALYTAEKPSFPVRWIPAAVAALVLLCVLFVLPGRKDPGPEYPTAPSGALTAETAEATAPSLTEQPDAYSAAEEHCAKTWENGGYDAVLQELQTLANDNPQDSRYAQLLQYYESLLEETILSDAREHVSAGQFREAIRLLDEGWKRYRLQGLYAAAADYRMDFGLSNTATIAAGKFNSVLIRSNGSVTVAGDNEFGELDARHWSGIVSVSAGDRHIVGLRSNGTVVSAGENDVGQRDVSSWSNVVAIAAGDCHTVALLRDGTLRAAGQTYTERCDVNSLQRQAGGKRIVSITAGYVHTLALLEDGTVIATGENGYLQCDVSHWTDIAAIYAGTYYSAGLKTDGTVVLAGISGPDCSGWMDVDNLAAGDYFIVGLTSQGTLISSGIESAIGSATAGIISQWTDIRQIAAGHDHILAVNGDGIIFCAGENKKNQLDLHGVHIS